MQPHDSTPRKTYPVLLRRWQGMRQYVRDPNHSMFPRYGARGISICPAWNSFPVFLAWAQQAGWKEPGTGIEISRLDVDGDFSPTNCRLSTPIERANNTSQTLRVTAWGEKKSASDWARDPRCKVSAGVLRKRIHLGVEPHRALSLPNHAPVEFCPTSRSGYMGVTCHPQTGRFQAMIRDRYLGLFADPVEAARVYDRAAVELFGPWAILNFPSEHPDPLS